MLSIPAVVAISFAFWLVVYIGWLVFSPSYREQEAAGWRRMGEPHAQNFISYAMAVIIGGIFATELFGPEFQLRDLVPVAIGIGGLVGLVIITRKRLRS